MERIELILNDIDDEDSDNDLQNYGFCPKYKLYILSIIILCILTLLIWLAIRE